ncbi:hypothetical protein H113_05486 [Trichophyton rubrum MR1459]|nr:hypothetical protein H102_05416 [Trichophyton rubrum CBS 100081]EZF93827.1 hypothetical protein H113_05486 [Trichophyton rubrum MR1459]KMQ49179.1 hypothetical protein HL42_0320 [Trichophyton rubrum]
MEDGPVLSSHSHQWHQLAGDGRPASSIQHPALLLSTTRQGQLQHFPLSQRLPNPRASRRERVKIDDSRMPDAVLPAYSTTTKHNHYTTAATVYYDSLLTFHCTLTG